MWVRKRDFVELRDRVEEWLRLPLQTLDPERLDGEFTFTRLPGQRLTLRFGARQDTVDERKPTVSVFAAAGSLVAEWHFVTDQSCLRLFAQELTSWIDGIKS